MSLKNLADDTLSALDEALPDHDISEEQKQAVLKIIEDTLIKTVNEAKSAHHEATEKCCGPESDMAHQIRKEVTQAYNLLTTNLSAMR